MHTYRKSSLLLYTRIMRSQSRDNGNGCSNMQSELPNKRVCSYNLFEKKKSIIISIVNIILAIFQVINEKIPPIRLFWPSCLLRSSEQSASPLRGCGVYYGKQAKIARFRTKLNQTYVRRDCGSFKRAYSAFTGVLIWLSLGMDS